MDTAWTWVSVAVALCLVVASVARHMRGRQHQLVEAPVGHFPALVAYGTSTGQSLQVAKVIANLHARRGGTVAVRNLRGFEVDSLLAVTTAIVVMPTYNTGGRGSPPADAKAFVDELLDMARDHRVSKVRRRPRCHPRTSPSPPGCAPRRDIFGICASRS